MTTDDSGRVTALEIAELSGKLPPELGNLTSLQTLRIHYSQLDGEIPPELSNLTSLRELYLELNQLDGKIPPELGNLTSLLVLDLGNNQLRGEIPPELGNLTSLRTLRIHNNQLSGRIPPELENLRLGERNSEWDREGLVSDSEFWGNNFSGCVSEYFLENMANVNLAKCAPPDHPGDTETLIALYDALGKPDWENWLGRGSIRDWHGVTVDSSGRVAGLFISIPSWDQKEIPPELGNLVNLKELALWGGFRGEIPPELGNLVNLRVLWLNIEGDLTGCIPARLQDSLGYISWLPPYCP